MKPHSLTIGPDAMQACLNHHARLAFTRPLLLGLVACLTLLPACRGSKANPIVETIEAEGYSLYDRGFASNSGYATPSGYKTECLGRQLVDVPGEVEWAMVKPLEGQDYDWTSPYFNRKMVVMEDGASGFDFFVGASDETARSLLEKAIEVEEGDVRIGISETKHDIEVATRVLASGRASGNFDQETITSEQDDIASLKAFLARQTTFDVGLPDSYGAYNARYTRIYLYRAGRLYIFTGYRGEDVAARDRYKDGLVNVVKNRFRPRSAYEIPTDGGFCIPYGFIADAPGSHPHYRVQATFREKAMPNVLYTLKLERNLSFRVPGSGPIPGGVTGTGSLATLLRLDIIGLIARSSVKRTIRDTDFSFGAYPAEISGAIGDGKLPGEKRRNYVLTAGFQGGVDDDVLPSMQLMVNGYPTSTDASLKLPTPKVEDTLVKAQAIARSVRWRPVVGQQPPQGITKRIQPKPETDAKVGTP